MIASAPWAGVFNTFDAATLLAGAILVLRNQITADAGTGLVSQWTDESGNGHHALPISGITRPTALTTNTAGNKDVSFTGTQGLRIPSLVIPAGTTDMTLFVGYEKTQSGSQERYMLELSSASLSLNNAFYVAGFGVLNAWLRGNVGLSSESSVPPAGISPLWAVRTEFFKSSTTREVRILRDGNAVNGTVTNADNTNTFGTNALSIGIGGNNSSPLIGKLSSIILFPFQVTGDRAADIEAFLIKANS